MGRRSALSLGLKEGYDCILLVVPRVAPVAPTPGSAKLKAVGEAHGFKIQTGDLNVRLWHLTPMHGELWGHNDVSFVDPAFFGEVLEDSLGEIIDSWVDQVARARPRWLGLSCLSYQSHLFVQEFCQRLRKKSPEQKAMIGGPGANSFGAELHRRGLIDAFVLGDGEAKFLRLLRGESAEAEADLPRFEFEDIYADYSDFDFSLYAQELKYPFDIRRTKKGLRTLFITGSKGCIRKCSFCDVRDVWKRFIFRDGEEIAKEIIEYSRRYGATNFFFTDSLVNGAPKSFLALCRALSTHNAQARQRITFEGYLICRSQKDFPPEHFELMKRAGMRRLYIGVESGSDFVREHMAKGYTRKDLDYFVAQMHRTGMQMTMLLMVGYPTETEEDFQDTLQLLKDYHQLGYLGHRRTISDASFNWSTVIPPRTPLAEQIKELDIKMTQQMPGLWTREFTYVSREGETIREINSPTVRILRYKRLVALCGELGLRLRNIENELQRIERRLVLGGSATTRRVRARKRGGERIPPDTIVAWHPKVIGSKVFSQVFVIFDRRTGKALNVEGIATEACALIDGKATVTEIIHEVASLKGLPRKVVSAEVEALVVDLGQRGVLEGLLNS